MKVTKRWCSNCEGAGQLVDVVNDIGETVKGLPAISMAGAARSRDEDDDSEPDDCPITKATKPYPCRKCGGPGFHFYIEERDRFGESIRLDQLPGDAEVVGVSGSEEWMRHHQNQSAGYLWTGR